MTQEYIAKTGYALAQAGKKGVLVVVPTAALCLNLDIKKMSSVQELVERARKSSYSFHETLEAGLFFSVARVETLISWNAAQAFAAQAARVDTVKLIIM